MTIQTKNVYINIVYGGKAPKNIYTSLLYQFGAKKKMEKSKIVKSWELKATSQKSFYKKAYVLEDEKGNLFLQSYDTIVCGIINGIFKKFWDGYSKTTQTHINDFRSAHNLSTLYKKEWESLSTDNDPVSYYDHENTNMGNQYYGTPFACRW